MCALHIEAMRESDWPAVSAIYSEGILTGHATFAAAPPATWAEWSAGKIGECRLVARNEADFCIGWAALSLTSARAVYRGVAEVSIYIAAGARGAGAGGTLLRTMVAESEMYGYWTLTAGIFPENVASLRLHAACGFRTVGTLQQRGRMEYGPHAGRWRDVILLERRSRSVGVA